MQVQFHTAQTAVCAGGKNYWNSLIKVLRAVIRKFGPISQFGDFHNSLLYHFFVMNTISNKVETTFQLLGFASFSFMMKIDNYLFY